jgi:site-specific DNA-cytosine methylase
VKRVFTCLFAFCGIGLGAAGFLEANVQLRGEDIVFRSLGGIDNDPLACADFEMLTKSPALCADISKLQPAELRAFAGAAPPDCVFLSAPCKGFSALLSAKASRKAKYQSMNRLALDWIELMLSTWDVPPRLVLFENVPRVASRGAAFLERIKKLLRGAGYLFHAQTHDCGELGGLAQHRVRYLLVARHPGRCAPLLYQPPPKRVRACGEVLGALPLPEDPDAGAMHRLPKLSWLNWVRLALIPAGGDWRDLEGVLKNGQARREVHRRHRVEKWEEPTSTVAGSGSNGPSAVADPRVDEEYRGAYGVQDWEKPSGVVTGSASVSRGRFAVADPRTGRMGVNGWNAPTGAVCGESLPSNGAFSVADPRTRGNVDRVTPWTEAIGTITSSPAPSSGGAAVADPRIVPQAGNPNTHWNKYSVGDWNDPAHTVTGAGRVGSGAPSVADPRVSLKKDAYPHSYGVLRWDEPSSTIAGGTQVGQGAYSVADIRFGAKYYAGTYGVLSWEQAAATITGRARIDTGMFAVADPRKPPPELPMIIAADGTWHRPLTTLELYALQGGDAIVDGKGVALAGDASGKWRERIGNGVPKPTGRAIAEQMLVCLAAAKSGTWQLSGGGAVWVEHDSAMQ